MRKLRVIRVSSTVLDNFKSNFSHVKNKSEFIRRLLKEIPSQQSDLKMHCRQIKEDLTQLPLYLTDSEYEDLKQNMEKFKASSVPYFLEACLLHASVNLAQSSFEKEVQYA